MPYDSQGVFTRVMNWQEDAANSVPIVASRHDDEDDNFAQGFNEVFCRDGRAAMTGNLKMGLNKITGLANGTTTNDAVNKSQLDALNMTLTTAISTAITNCKKALFPVGSVYATIGNTNPNTLLGFGTWTNLCSTLVTTLPKETPVYGDDDECLKLKFGQDEVYNMISSSYSHDGNIDGLTLGTDNISRVNKQGKVNIISKEKSISANTPSTAYADTSTATKITVYLWQRTV